MEINSYGTDPLKRGATSLAEDKESEVERLKREKESIVSLLIYLRSRIKTNGTYAVNHAVYAAASNW